MKKFLNILEQNPYLISLFIIAILIYWFGEAPNLRKQNNSPVLKKHEVVLPKVVIKDENSKTIENSINAFGTSKPYKDNLVKAKFSGEIVNVYKNKGDVVKKGDVIAKIDSKPLESQLEALNQKLDEINLKLNLNKKLYNSKFSSKIDLSEVISGQKEVMAKIAKVEHEINDTYIKSNINGILGDFNLKVGDFVVAGQPVVQVNDVSKFIITANIPENEINEVKNGSSAVVKFGNDKSEMAKVTYVNDVADPITHTYKIEITADNKKHMSVGSSLSVSILTNKINAFDVSPSELFVNTKSPESSLGLKIVKNNKVEFLPVKIIKSSSTGLWVSANAENIKLIISGGAYVENGQKVKIEKNEFKNN